MTPKTTQQPLPQLPAAVPPPPVFGAPTSSKPQQKNPTPTFLGTNAIPSAGNKGTKQLVGQ